MKIKVKWHFCSFCSPPVQTFGTGHSTSSIHLCSSWLCVAPAFWCIVPTQFQSSALLPGTLPGGFANRHPTALVALVSAGLALLSTSKEEPSSLV